MTLVAITTSSFNEANLPDQLRRCAQVLRNTTGRRMTEDEVEALLSQGVVGIIAGVEPLTARVLRRAKQLKVVSRVGTGVDNIDLAVAGELGITIRRTPDAPTEAVAELTIGLMLAVLRNVVTHDRAVRSGNWQVTSGHLLRGRRVGLVGAGRIGQEVARLLDAFGASVAFHDPFVPSLGGGLRSRSLEDLLSESEIVSLHLPLSEATHHFIGSAELSQMPQKSILINVARGGLVDERALLKALNDGDLAGAALDCFEEEPYVGPLRALEQVVLSPHAGSAARETRDRMEAEAAQTLLAELMAHGDISG